MTALTVLGPTVKSGNNSVRIQAINAVMKAVAGTPDERAYQAALDLLVASLDSNAAIGGMEVRMMAVVAVERIGLGAADAVRKQRQWACCSRTRRGAAGSLRPEGTPRRPRRSFRTA